MRGTKKEKILHDFKHIFMLYYLSVCCKYNDWAREASHTLGCSIEISYDIYIYSVSRGPKSVGGITWA